MLGSLLIDELPIQFLPSLAEKLGVSAAVIMQQVHFLLVASKENYFDGRHWRDDVYEQCCRLLPCWDTATIYGLINNLLEAGYLVRHSNKGMQKHISINYDQLS